MENALSLVSLNTITDVKIVKPGKALPATIKKSADEVHTPTVKGGYVRLFKDFYEINNQNVVDPKTKKRIVEKETYTRYIQLPGQSKTAIYTTKEILFIPLDFKFGRKLYLEAWEEGKTSPPDCQSSNGIVPLTNKFATECDVCEYSRWEGSTPPKCNELPEILALDMTSKKINDPEVAAAVTAEAVTINFTSSANGAVKKLMKTLAEPVLFDDGTYGAIDMTQYLVSATLYTYVDKDGKEKNYCIPEFTIVGQVPFNISEQLLEMLNKPIPEHNNQTVRELFIGNTIPFDSVEKEAPKAKPEPTKAEKASPPKAKAEVKVEKKAVVIETKAEPAPKTLIEDEPEAEIEEEVAIADSEVDEDEVVF